MGLDNKAAALTLAERAIAANPIEKDAIAGPGPIEILARVAAGQGETDRAIAALQKLVCHSPMADFWRPAYTGVAAPRSNVRSAPKRSALPKARGR